MQSVLIFSLCLASSLYSAAASKKQQREMANQRDLKASYANTSVYNFIKKNSEMVEWECGPRWSDYLTPISDNFVSTACSPEARNLFKYACMKHDNCYSCDRGQFYCDMKFCGMMETAVVLGEGSSACSSLAASMCKTVVNFGHNSYSSDASCVPSMNDEFAV